MGLNPKKVFWGCLFWWLLQLLGIFMFGNWFLIIIKKSSSGKGKWHLEEQCKMNYTNGIQTCYHSDFFLKRSYQNQIWERLQQNLEKHRGRKWLDQCYTSPKKSTSIWMSCKWLLSRRGNCGSCYHKSKADFTFSCPSLCLILLFIL